MHNNKLNNGNIVLYSSQREIKPVLRSYTLMHNEELNRNYISVIQSHTALNEAVYSIDYAFVYVIQ